MVSDSELIDRLRDFLSKSDLDTTTTGQVRKKLEEDFGINLSKKKAFIREQVDLYVQSQFNNAEEENEDDGDVKSEVEEDEEESKKGPEKKKRKGGGGFAKVCSLSPQLQKFTGVPELARTEVVKKMWSYIREHDLQEPTNRRNILCDENLKELFRVDKIDMFQMNKALAKHIWPLDSDGAAPSKSTPKEKPQKHDRDDTDDADDAEDSKKKGKRQKGSASGSGRGGGGFMKPIRISDRLIKFLEIEETELPRSDVVKRIWDYIKLNNLQDPSDKRKIICDEKLKELFDVDTFVGFTMSKLLTAHFIKAE